MLADQHSSLTLIGREKRRHSIFRPPKFAKALPPQKKTLTATARPWYPAAREEKPLALAAPVLAPPPALGEAPEQRPKIKTTLPPMLTDMSMEGSVNSPQSSVLSPFSPLSTTIQAFSHTFSAEATTERVYPLDMFISVRKDASHTPHGVLVWCVRQYLEVPSLKVPTHLQLSMNEVIRSEDGVTRGALGSGLTTKSRAKPARQIHHKVMSILSRITPQKYNELLLELLELPLRQTDDVELQEVVKVFFDKAVQEPEYSALYSELVRELCTMKENERGLESELRERLLCNRMRHELVMTCQEQFRRPIELSPDEKVDRTTGTPLDEEEIELKRKRMKDRLVGNIKFVGELFKMALVTDRVIEDILHLLVGEYDLQNPTAKEEYVFEVFIMLVKTVADIFKNIKPNVLTQYLGIAKCIELSHPKKRIHFLMMDLGDLNRKNHWIHDERVQRAADSLLGNQRLPYSSNKQLTPSSSALLSSPGVSREDRSSNGASFSSGSYPSTATHGSTLRNGNGKPLQQPPPPRGSIASSARDQNGSGAANALNSSIKANSNTSNLFTPTSVSDGSGFYSKDANSNNINSNQLNSHHTSPVNRQSSIKHGVSPASPLNPSRLDARFSPLTPNLANTSTGSLAPSECRSTSTGATEMVNIQQLASQLMRSYNLPEEASGVVKCIDSMSLKNKILCLTWWLRQVSTNTSLFEERQRITNLLSDILTSCHSITPAELQSAILEWIRFDIEKGEYVQCPRMFDNIAHMILYCYSPETADLPNIHNVRELLHGGLFNVMLHELTTDKGTDQMVTLAKSAHHISVNLLNTITDPATPQDALRIAVMNRFRLLPYFLSVSSGTESEMPGTPPTRCRTPTTSHLHNSPLGDSITSTCHYDPLSQCLAFQKVAEDPEFHLFWKIRDDSTENTWKEEAVRLALSPVCGINSLVAQAVQVMKVVGALLACTTVSQCGNSLVSFADVDDVVTQILSRKRSPVIDAAAVMEVIMHFTQALNCTVDAPRKSTRIKPLRQTFGRWCAQKMVDKSVVMDLIRSLGTPEDGTISAYVAFHDSVADAEVPWRSMLTCLS